MARTRLGRAVDRLVIRTTLACTALAVLAGLVNFGVIGGTA